MKEAGIKEGDDEEDRKTEVEMLNNKVGAQQVNPLVDSNRLSGPIVILNAPGGADIRMKQMQSFNSQGNSKFLVTGGPSLLSPEIVQSVPHKALIQAQQAALVHQYVQNAALNESKGIQTSI
jgi:hypothetical protein